MLTTRLIQLYASSLINLQCNEHKFTDISTNMERHIDRHLIIFNRLMIELCYLSSHFYIKCTVNKIIVDFVTLPSFCFLCFMSEIFLARGAGGEGYNMNINKELECIA